MMRYSIYPGILEKIKETLKKEGLKILSEDPQFFVQKKLRFYHAICENKEGKKVFFKSLLKREPGIKNRFLNEINFLKEIKEKKNLPLAKKVPKILKFSLKRDFPFLIYEFLPGKSKKREDSFSKEEIKEIVALMKLIRETDFKFNFIPKEPLFNFQKYSKKINFLTEKLKLEGKLKKKILRIVQKSKEIFKKVKPKLSHGDFSEANLIFFKGKVKIVDWEHVHFRNPLYDFVSFWTKRKREREILEREFLKQNGKIEYFFPLFLLSLIEISLSNLIFFEEMIYFAKKEKDKIGIEKRKKEIEETLTLLKKYL